MIEAWLNNHAFAGLFDDELPSDTGNAKIVMIANISLACTRLSCASKSNIGPLEGHQQRLTTRTACNWVKT